MAYFTYLLWFIYVYTQLMGHSWITSGTLATSVNLQEQQGKIKKYLANRRFRKAAFAVMAVNRVKFLTLARKKAPKEDTEKKPLDEEEDVQNII